MILLTDRTSGPSISIAMATYNGGRYLRQQLDSLARQTYLPGELVITDDMSTDDTEAVVMEFAATAPFSVRFFKNEQRLGYRHNFTRAISYCTSDLIAFCDQDDVWYPGKLKCAAAAFADPTVMLWHHNARLVNNEWDVLGVVESPNRPQVSHRFSLSPWQGANGFTQVFRRSFGDFAAYWPHSIDTYEVGLVTAHDRWTFFLASFLGSIVYEPKILADYRQHDRNVYGNMHSEKGFRQRVRYWSRNREPVYRLLRLVAERNAELLSGMMTESCVTPELRVNLVDASIRYAALSRLYARRLDVYSGDFKSRAVALLSLLRSRAYSESGIWNFGHGALIKDLVMGSILGPKTRQRPHQVGKDIDIDMSCRPGRRFAVAA